MTITMLRRTFLAGALLWAAVAPVQALAPTQDWPKALADWTARSQQGDREAPRNLCELYFGGRGTPFDAGKTVEWCRRAADLGDAQAMQRLGLLTLAGIGAPADLAEAARLCIEAHTRDAAVSAAFCLAGVAVLQPPGASATPASPAAAAPEPAAAKAVAHWLDLSDRGDRAAPAHLCELYFEARGVPFDPAKWCRRAADFGDAAALQRLGLLHVWGIGGVEKDNRQAEALCTEAQSRDSTVSAAYCVAAAREERKMAAVEAQPAHVDSPVPYATAPDAATTPSPLLADRVLSSVHETATGLPYTCRIILRWSRYETANGLSVVLADSRLFGRPIMQYRPEDYAGLARAAANCATAIAPYDSDGALRAKAQEFRSMLPQLEARQRALRQDAQNRQSLTKQLDLTHGAVHRESDGITQLFQQFRQNGAQTPGLPQPLTGLPPAR